MKQKNKEQNHNKKYIAIEILVGILVSLGIFFVLVSERLSAGRRRCLWTLV